jgi:hypothetical protein
MSDQGADQKHSSEKMSLEDIVFMANKVGMEYAKARKESEHLELLKPTIKSRAMIRHDSGDVSEAKLKRLAETDDEYVRFLLELATAKSESERLRIRYESYKNLFEARRSMLSYQKAEMKIL